MISKIPLNNIQIKKLKVTIQKQILFEEKILQVTFAYDFEKNVMLRNYYY